MTNEFHIQQLQKIRQFLVFNDWDTAYEKEDGVYNYDRLVVKMYVNIDAETRFWPLELSFLPGLEKDLGGFSILQCYVPVIANVPVNMEIPLTEMINMVNTKLVLGSFGLLTPEHLFFYKHSTILSDPQLQQSHAVINETVSMISYLLTNFHEAFTNVVLGKMTVIEAVTTMPFSKVYT